MQALLLAMLLFVSPIMASTPSTPYLNHTINNSSAGVTHDENGLEVGLTFADGFSDSFTIDTGSTVTMMNSYDLVVLALHGHAKIIGADYFAGVDGVQQLYPLYIVDQVKIGDCTIHGAPGSPTLLIAGGSSNLLGRTLLDQLGTYSLDDKKFSFACPRESK